MRLGLRGTVNGAWDWRARVGFRVEPGLWVPSGPRFGLWVRLGARRCDTPLDLPLDLRWWPLWRWQA